MTFKHLAGASLAALALTLAACGDKAHNEDGSKVATEMSTKPVLGTFGISLKNMDETVVPGDDFFRYVNGTWLKEKEIPSDRSRYGAFNLLADQAEVRVREIIETAATKDDPSADEKRIGDFYNAYLNEEAIETKGLKPISTTLQQINKAKSHADILALMADPALGLDAPVSPYVYICLLYTSPSPRDA